MIIIYICAHTHTHIYTNRFAKQTKLYLSISNELFAKRRTEDIRKNVIFSLGMKSRHDWNIRSQMDASFLLLLLSPLSDIHRCSVYLWHSQKHQIVSSRIDEKCVMVIWFLSSYRHICLDRKPQKLLKWPIFVGCISRIRMINKLIASQRTQQKFKRNFFLVLLLFKWHAFSSYFALTFQS